jgi:hypothetical protein
VSILNRFDEHFNIHTNRCEIPLILAGQRRHRTLDGVLKPLINIFLSFKKGGQDYERKTEFTPQSSGTV